MRIAITPSLTTAIADRYIDSGILLSSKLAALSRRCGTFYAYLCLPPPTDFLPTWAREHLIEAPVATDFQSYVVVTSPKETLRALAPYGVDMIFFTTAESLALYASYIFSAKFVKLMDIPLVLWDFSPSSPECMDNMSITPQRMMVSAWGYLAAKHIIEFSEVAKQMACEAVRQQFGLVLAEETSKKITVMSPSIDMRLMDEALAGHEIRKRERFTVHLGGRWAQTKGLEYLMDILTVFKSSGLDIDVLFTGEKPRDMESKKAIAQVGAIMKSCVSQSEMWKMAAECHIGILWQDCEAMPCMPLEQLYLGLPVLIRSVPALADVLRGYPHVFKTKNELKQLLLFTMQNYERVVAESRKWAQENLHRFDISQMETFLAQLDCVASTTPYDRIPIELDDEGRPEDRIFIRRFAKLLSDSPVNVKILRHALRKRGYKEDLTQREVRFIKEDDGHQGIAAISGP